MVRRLQPPLLRTIATLFVSVWALGLGCNPSLITAVGGNPVNSVNTPDGYIMVLLINRTTASINAELQVSNTAGATFSGTYTVGPEFAFNIAYDCNLTSIQFVTFGYSTTGGVVTNPSNLGPINAGQGLDCGKVVAVTATGSPPTFSVQVY